MIVERFIKTKILIFAVLSISAQAHVDDNKAVKRITKTVTLENANDIQTKTLVTDSVETSLEHDAISTVVAFHRALKASDKVKARSLLANNVTIFEGGRVERSADGYAAHHMIADMKYLADITIDIIDQQVMMLGNLAYISSVTKSTGTYQGKNIENKGLETIVLSKVSGEWKIIHIHWS